MRTEITLHCHICNKPFQRQLAIWRYKVRNGQKGDYCTTACSSVAMSRRKVAQYAQKRNEAENISKSFDWTHFDPYQYFCENWNYAWLEKRLNKVDEAPCWIWTGTYHCGYPAYRMKHPPTGRTFNLRMRKIFAPEMKQRVYTTCENIACVNPEHLYN